VIQAQENKEHESLIRDKKAEVDALRNEIRSLVAQISELNNAILKIELAGRLHCSTNDLETKVVECPVDKLGEVIGKGGSKLKELQQQTGCVVEVDRNSSKVTLKGNNSAIQHAVKKIEDIILILTMRFCSLPKFIRFYFQM
jgi:Polyribonucleotide nucleotidyltransferase (polynucleotide phosphorylase)